ncbi:MAG TPA: hypothetical protein VHW25_16430 [Steroidobacteraceae bacterium]|jgi:hypothetical protein|nr:hypothetical protein [Steroidobacteraceae bacterium]
MAATDAGKIGSEIIDAILENDSVKVAEAVRKAQLSVASVTRAAPRVGRRRLVLVVAATVAALMLLFPPFHVVVQAGSGNFGYAWLFTPPRSMGRVVATVDVFTLLLEYVGLLVVTALLYLALSPERRTQAVGVPPVT